MLEIAGRDQHHARRGIVALQIARDGVAVEPADDLGAAQHRPAHRLIGKGALLEQIEDDVVGRVLGLADLLQHDGALALELARVEGRMLQDVGEDVDGERRHRSFSTLA